jgi:hypothetical protein
MDFETALRFLRAFSACHLRLVRGFSGFPYPYSHGNEGGYVVFSDVSLANESCYRELENFAEKHDLSITPFGDYLMFSGSDKKSKNVSG